MSFILDALKKSESDRQRQSGPALYEVKVAAPRSQLPYWAIGLIVLLGVNLVIVAWALLRRPSHAPDTPAVAAANVPAPAPAPAPQSAVPYAPQPPQAPAPAPSAASQGPTTFIAGSGQEPPAQRAAPAAGPAANSDLPPEEDSTGGSGRPANAQAASRAAPVAPGEVNTNPDDYAPATEPSKASGLGFHVTRGTAEGVPLYSQVSSGAGIPELRLDMHAYDTNPQKRFVLINMKKEREGDLLPDGTTRVDTITPDGVVLDHRGTKFLLPRP
ncbi:MAG TPA: general secretion pathway protein GspB [Steroidobacteraceae bacterium]|nr:general secretion pathway protein GspB [Steroidobacteraceae bacterium]